MDPSDEIPDQDLVRSARRGDEAALSAHMSDRLARYKCPRLYIRVDALTRNPNGKIQRRAMAAAYEAQT